MEKLPTILITGATSGIGQLAAIELARGGAHLILTARSEERAASTRAAIESAAPGTNVDIHYVDFTSLAAVASAGREILARHERIDVLINNAGLHAFEQRVTVDGYPEMIAVNYLAPWLLTHMLRDRLVRSSPARIVTIASEASRQSGGLTPRSDLTNTAAFSARGSSAIYGKSKLLDIMFSLELARQLQGTSVVANCLCPGFNVTGLGRELGFAAALSHVLNWLKIGDPRRGAGIIVRLATDPAFGVTSGAYVSVRNARPLTPIPPGDDVGARQGLWSLTAELLADHLGAK